MQEKDNFVNTFQAWLSQVETESNCLIEILQVDKIGEFIFSKLQTFYEKRGVIIKYAISYILEKNELAEKRW